MGSPGPASASCACSATSRLAAPRPCRARLSPDRHADLQEHRFHPGQPAVPPDRSRRAHSGHRSRQPARPRLLPLRRTTMLVHPTLDLLASLGLHGRRSLPGSGGPTRGPRRCSMPNGSLCCSIGRRRRIGKSASRRAPGLPVCAIRPASRTSTSTPPAGSIAASSSSPISKGGQTRRTPIVCVCDACFRKHRGEHRPAPAERDHRRY